MWLDGCGCGRGARHRRSRFAAGAVVDLASAVHGVSRRTIHTHCLPDSRSPCPPVVTWSQSRRTDSRWCTSSMAACNSARWFERLWQRDAGRGDDAGVLAQGRCHRILDACRSDHQENPGHRRRQCRCGCRRSVRHELARRHLFGQGGKGIMRVRADGALPSCSCASTMKKPTVPKCCLTAMRPVPPRPAPDPIADAANRCSRSLQVVIISGGATPGASRPVTSCTGGATLALAPAPFLRSPSMSRKGRSREPRRR